MKSIFGKNVGGISVFLPEVAKRSGRKKCSASVSGFSQAEGDVFYKAFQIAARVSAKGSRLRFWGRYMHGRSEMGMKL